MVGQLGAVSEEVHGVGVSDALGDQGLPDPGLHEARLQRLGVTERLVGQLREEQSEARSRVKQELRW